MYHEATETDHAIAREEYVNREVFPSRCVHSVPMWKKCRDCEIDEEFLYMGIVPMSSLSCFDPRD